MKQELISFLGEDWRQSVADIVESSNETATSIYVYPAHDFLSQTLLTRLIKFANKNGYHFYISAFNDVARMRIYREAGA